MIQVNFKNLDKSELAQTAAVERIEALIEKFPDLQGCRISITFEMENSPFQAGPDLFTAAVHVKDGRYRGVRLKKSESNLYAALADLVDHMLEKLNRFGDRSRVKERTKARKLAGLRESSRVQDEDFSAEHKDTDEKQNTRRSYEKIS